MGDLETWLMSTIEEAVKRAVRSEIDAALERAMRAVAHTKSTGDGPTVPLPEEQPLLTISEVVPFLRCGKSTVYSLIRRGDLKVIKNGQRLWIPTVELRRYLRMEGDTR